jgi:hypothetical protein
MRRALCPLYVACPFLPTIVLNFRHPKTDGRLSIN